MIDRDATSAARDSHDVVVVGGGVYGITLALEAARRGLRPLLLERGDFGGGTSWNSLRIVHGGLRYLQSFDLHRFRESVAERSWLLRNFPEQVEPLPCLMPLYGRGLHRPGILKMALLLNDVLSLHRNRGVREDRVLDRGEILGPADTVSAFPAVDSAGLRGAAFWTDAVMPDSQRLLLEMLRWACACGARALNYVQVDDLLVEGGRVAGVRAHDVESGAEHEFRGTAVVNAAGPACRALANEFDRDLPELFRPSLAFNALLDREPLSNMALAVAPRRKGARTYFLHPWKGRVFAGTYHAPWSGPMVDDGPGEECVEDFLADLNAAIPGFEIARGEVLRLHWGYLPAAADGTADLAVRERVWDHGAQGGPTGLFSVSGVKFTTARRVAEKTLRVVARSRGADLPEPGGVARPAGRAVPAHREFEILLEREPESLRRLVEQIAREEAVVRIEDLVLRRTDWGMDPRDAEAAAKALSHLLEGNGPKAGTARAAPASGLA